MASLGSYCHFHSQTDRDQLGLIPIIKNRRSVAQTFTAGPEQGDLGQECICCVLGNEIATLVNEEKEAGYHSIDFNVSDQPRLSLFLKI